MEQQHRRWQTLLGRFDNILGRFTSGMLVTHAVQGTVRARPMVIARVDPEGNLWFVSRDDSDKVTEIAEDPRVGVTMQQGDSVFLSVSGTARVVRDPILLARMWDRELDTLYPEGRGDPRTVLIRVSVHEVEYWDRSGLKRWTFALDGLTARLPGNSPAPVRDPRVERHGRFQLV